MPTISKNDILDLTDGVTNDVDEWVRAGAQIGRLF